MSVMLIASKNYTLFISLASSLYFPVLVLLGVYVAEMKMIKQVLLNNGGVPFRSSGNKHELYVCLDLYTTSNYHWRQYESTLSKQ